MSWPKARLGDVGIHGDPMEVALGFYAQNKVRRIVLNCESAAMLGSGGN